MNFACKNISKVFSRKFFQFQLKYAEFSCSFFYDSCDSMEKTAWSDPLQCRWCAMKNGSGYAFSLEQGNTCQFYLVGDLCVPHIEHVSFFTLSNSVILMKITRSVPKIQFVESKELKLPYSCVHAHKNDLRMIRFWNNRKNTSNS